jgi:hypothetical protein
MSDKGCNCLWQHGKLFCLSGCAQVIFLPCVPIASATCFLHHEQRSRNPLAAFISSCAVALAAPNQLNLPQYRSSATGDQALRNGHAFHTLSDQSVPCHLDHVERLLLKLVLKRI